MLVKLGNLDSLHSLAVDYALATVPDQVTRRPLNRHGQCTNDDALCRLAR